MEDGLPTPELDDAPTVPSSLLWVSADFARLESERSVGMGVGPVPVTRMYEYLERTRTDPDLWEECIAYWTALDMATLAHHAEKVKREAPKVKAKGGGNIVAPQDFPELGSE